MNPVIPVIRLGLAVEKMYIDTRVLMLRHRRTLLLYVMLLGLIMMSEFFGKLPG